MRKVLTMLLCFFLVFDVLPVSSHAESEDDYYDTIFLGSYEQELDPSFVGPEGIEWLLLDTSEDGSKGLLC